MAQSNEPKLLEDAQGPLSSMATSIQNDRPANRSAIPQAPGAFMRGSSCPNQEVPPFNSGGDVGPEERPSVGAHTRPKRRQPTLKPEDGDEIHIYDSAFTDITLNLTQIFNTENHEGKIPGWLSSMEYSDIHNDFSKKRLIGAGAWFLDSTEFMTWLQNPYRNLLWCPGIPGAGKTIIASLVIDEVRKRKPDAAVAYIYYSYKQYKQQNLTASVETICRQVHETCRATKVPSDFQSLYISHMKHKSRPTPDELLKSLRKTISNFPQAYLILDALDEYLETYSDDHILQLLQTVTSLGDQVKILITSRILGQMESLFAERKALKKEIFADSEDLRVFIGAGIANMKNLKVSERLSKQVIEEVSTVAKGRQVQYYAISHVTSLNKCARFLMAELHMNSLSRQKTIGNLKETLKTLPNEVDQTYALAMKRIESLEPESRELAKKTLMWVTHARRPMLIEELRHALATEPGREEIEDFLYHPSQITSACAGLILIENDRVGFVHFTTQEFFDAHSEKLGYFGENPHKDMAQTCLDYLFLPCFCQLSLAYLSDSEPQKLDSLHQEYAFYDYAALNWGFHANSCAEDVQLAERILEMVQTEDSCLKLSLLNLFEQGSAEEIPAENGSGLFLAIYHRQISAFKHLVAESAGPITRGGTTPFMFAANLGRREFIDLMLKNWDVNPYHYCESDLNSDRFVKSEAHIHATDSWGNTALLYAAEVGHTAVVELLLHYPGPSLNLPNRVGYTPLMAAAEDGHHLIVDLLLDQQNINVNARCNEGFSALIKAVQSTNNPALKPLLKCPALDVNTQTPVGRTALWYAASRGDIASVRLLLRHRSIDISLASNDGLTPFFVAAMQWHTSVMEILLQHQGIGDSSAGMSILPPKPSIADLNAKSPTGWTVLESAAWEGHDRTVAFLLEQADIEADARDSHGCTALADAAEQGYTSIVRMLIDHGGVDINNVDDDGDTPLICAAYNGHSAVADILLSQPGVMVNLQDHRGRRTALSRACARHRSSGAGGGEKSEDEAYPFVETLLRREDIDVDLADEEGRTPLYYAMDSGFLRIADLLRGRGAVEQIDIDSNINLGPETSIH